MIYEEFDRAEFCPELCKTETEIKLRAYARPKSDLMASRAERWAVLILPGGGYRLTAESEGEPVALAFLAAGVQAFVLDYSVLPAQWPQAFLEAAAALAFIRKNAAKYGVRPDRVAVCGFSAGGHLAGCLANLWGDALLVEKLGMGPREARPDAAILCYPVITAGEHAIGDCFQRLTGEFPLRPEHEKLSLEKSVTAENPPAFLWTTVTDGTVNCENTMLYASALRAAGVPFELHMFCDGPHAMALATAESAWDAAYTNSHAAHWHGLCVEWLGRLQPTKS